MSNLVSSPKNVVYVNGGQTYNVSAADDVINVNSNLGATEIVLPNIVNQGLDFYPKKFTVNDTGGVAGTNAITISAVGNIVNSGTSFILNRNNVSSEIVIVSKTEYLVNTDNGGSTGVFGSGVAGQLAYFSASTVLGSLTNAQVTVLIDPMVGDSGSGGLKGLVPAPAAGDAAANKYLKADGTWNAISFAGYLKADGTVPLTANWDVGAFEVTAQSLKVDGTAGAGHFHLRYQSSIPTGAANNSKLFSGATGELGWVVDSNAYAFYLDMTGNTASRTLTVPNASGTIALTTDIVNLGNSNLTSSDNARTFTLKNGTTSSQYFQILNSASANLFTGRGDNKVVFGSSSIGLSIDKYLNNSVTTDTYINNVLFNRIQTNQRGEIWYNASGAGKVQINGTGEVSLFGALTEYNIYNNSNNRAVILACSNANTGQLLILNSSGVTKTIIEVGYSVFDSLMKIGGSYAVATAQLQVVGGGSTSATTTALFQNSASTNIFKVLDNGNTILNLPSTVAADGDLFNNGVNFYTDGTSLKARYKNNSGTASDLAIGSNIYNTSSTITDDARTVTLKSGGTASQNFQILNSASQIGYYFDGTGSVAIGTTTTSGKLTIKGSGSTSATTTALFQNSSSAKSLEILDSGAINIYNSGNFKIGYLNVYGGGVFGGNNNGGIGNDPNNVLGGSYQNGIILGGYTNTHNGYQGVIGGGFNTVTTNGTWNFVFSVGSTASAVAASVFGGGNHTASGAYSAVLGGDSNTASGIGAVAVGGNQASASGYRSFAQGYGSSAASDYAVVMGSYCSAVARSARAVGEYCVAAGVSSWVSGLGTNYGGTGKDLNASGLVSFNHSFNDGTVLYRSAEGDYSVILGGKNHWTKSGSTSSAILGGEGNTINASVLRSVILGGTGITATASDTAYAININASTLITTPQVITTPATITVAANAGTVTRANRINKFTNSSAATMTITMSTTAALDGDLVQVRIYDFSAATQTITWVNTENSSVTAPTTSNGSTTLPLTVGFQYNSATSKWRCIGSV